MFEQHVDSVDLKFQTVVSRGDLKAISKVATVSNVKAAILFGVSISKSEVVLLATKIENRTRVFL